MLNIYLSSILLVVMNNSVKREVIGVMFTWKQGNSSSRASLQENLGKYNLVKYNHELNNSMALVVFEPTSFGLLSCSSTNIILKRKVFPKGDSCWSRKIGKLIR